MPGLKVDWALPGVNLFFQKALEKKISMSPHFAFCRTCAIVQNFDSDRGLKEGGPARCAQATTNWRS
ncbi:MAG: hypothetical protein A2X49_12950 [Lentisphaerae bacterium GWF2_52_8]|nr:MAG: hypothetical protein A2X49_12950 [Lentisphaerae bacterium GWF2_52_8]